jgi:thioredoxin reductase
LGQADGHSLLVDGIFVAIGYRTNTDYLDALKILGRFITDINLNVSSDDEDYENIFAVGDCRYKPFNQVVIAMGEGCQAALSIIRDLEK